MLWTNFAFYSHVHLPSSDNVIQISKNKGHPRLVMNESSRIWNQEMKRKIKS